MTRTATPSPRFEPFWLARGIRLAVNRNRKLKTVLVKAYFTADLDEDVTRRALVPMVLRRGTRLLPDMQLLSRRREELFACRLYSSVAKLGEWHTVRFTLDVINEAFLPGHTGILRGGLELLRDLLFDPLVAGGGFRADYVEQEKENLRRDIESLLDDKAEYAAFRCTEEMCRNEPYRLNEQGRVEDLSAIDPAGLLRFHREWSTRAPVAVYVAGDVDERCIRDEVARVFEGGRGEPLALKPLPLAVEATAAREVEEQLEVNQGKLVLGFRHDVRYGDPEDEALVLMNTILGGGGNSRAKLFQNVRETASLAYSAYSSVERLKGLLFIACGIAAENFRRTLALCLEQLEAIRRGEVSDEEMECARETLLNSSRMLEDDYSALADADFARSLRGGALDLEALRARLRAVTLDDVVGVARRVQHDTTYFLRS